MVMRRRDRVGPAGYSEAERRRRYALAAHSLDGVLQCSCSMIVVGVCGDWDRSTHNQRVMFS